MANVPDLIHDESVVSHSGLCDVNKLWASRVMQWIGGLSAFENSGSLPPPSLHTILNVDSIGNNAVDLKGPMPELNSHQLEPWQCSLPPGIRARLSVPIQFANALGIRKTAN